MTNSRETEKPALLGKSQAFLRCVGEAKAFAGSRANVLIVGESGTGKELFARYLHDIEANQERPFIAVNCAAIPDQLIESELFGYERGAFTGAVAKKIGKFELANGGDIFLDEISSLKHELQAKILRVLQEKEIVRVGGNEHIKTNFRVIAATNIDLAPLVAGGLFRIDLFHRLRVVQLSIPPLRERCEDIPILADFFAKKYSQNPDKKISENAMQKLVGHKWQGNVRELENVIHAATVMSKSELINACDLPEWAFSSQTKLSLEHAAICAPAENDVCAATYRDFIDNAERLILRRALEKCEGDRSKTAQLLDISRTTLYIKLKQLGIFSKRGAI